MFQKTTLPALVLVLGLAACGGSVDAKEAAYDAAADGDHAQAIEHFQTALEGKTSADADYRELKIDQARSQGYVDASKVADAIKALSAEVTLSADDYKDVTSELVTARAFEPAVLVMDLGLKAFPGDPKMEAIKLKVIEESEAAGDEGALAALKGMGYL